LERAGRCDGDEVSKWSATAQSKGMHCTEWQKGGKGGVGGTEVRVWARIWLREVPSIWVSQKHEPILGRSYQPTNACIGTLSVRERTGGPAPRRPRRPPGGGNIKKRGRTETLQRPWGDKKQAVTRAKMLWFFHRARIHRRPWLVKRPDITPGRRRLDSKSCSLTLVESRSS
jgi:hypothetical protein